jgi:predicted double-glycine peptidase
MLLKFSNIRTTLTYDCGAVAVETSCRKLGIFKPKAHYFKVLGTNGINGTDPRTIEAFVRGENLKVLSGYMEVKDLEFLAEEGRVVIALVTFEGVGHYVVIRGVENGCVHYHDPGCGEASKSIDEFTRCWMDTDRFGVCYKQFGICLWR